jgi:hypothetical protein
VSNCHEVGIGTFGATVDIDHVLVSDTARSQFNDTAGFGLQLLDDDELGRSIVTMNASLIENNFTSGVLLRASDLAVEASLIRHVAPTGDGRFGYGIYAYQGALVTMTESRVEQVHDVGVMADDSSALLVAVAIEDVQTRADGSFGDGVSVRQGNFGAALDIDRSFVGNAARAGVSSFGAPVRLARSLLWCNAIQLNGETIAGASYAFDDFGGNRCGCNGDVNDCKVLSSMIEPPEPPDAQDDIASTPEGSGI